MQLLRAFVTSLANKVCSSYGTRILKLSPPRPNNIVPKRGRERYFDVFISYRGADTKKTIAKLLHYELSMRGLHAFFDKENVRPGDKLLDTIDSAIQRCKVGIVVFSPNYCDSYFCLYELARLLECKKRVIPVFCDVTPSKLTITNHESYSKRELERFMCALADAKTIAGLAFDTTNSDWLEFLTNTTDTVFENLAQVEGR